MTLLMLATGHYMTRDCYAAHDTGKGWQVLDPDGTELDVVGTVREAEKCIADAREERKNARPDR
jgi:hypothetical protein